MAANRPSSHISLASHLAGHLAVWSPRVSKVVPTARGQSVELIADLLLLVDRNTVDVDASRWRVQLGARSPSEKSRGNTKTYMAHALTLVPTIG